MNRGVRVRSPISHTSNTFSIPHHNPAYCRARYTKGQCDDGLAVAALVEGVSHVFVALVFAGEFLVSASLQIAVVRGRACVHFSHVDFVAACSGGWIEIARWET